MSRLLSAPIRVALACVLLALGCASSPQAHAEETLLEQAYRLDAGEFGPRDATGAAELYRRAAEAGDAHAHLRLGFLHETGDGVAQDYGRARAHYEFAAPTLPAARVRLALCHLEGWGCPVDRLAFVRELTTAAEAGSAEAQRMLGQIYGVGFIVPVDRAVANRWLERAAAQSDAVAQYALGSTAERARRLAAQPTLEAARTWYQLSAEQEYLDAMRALARTFLHGPAGQRDAALGRRWLELAAEAGDSEALFTLACFELLHADGGRDAAQARVWLTKASEAGLYRATEALDFEQAGQPLATALRYTLTEAQEDRYVRHLEQSAPTAAAADAPPRPTRVVRPVYPISLRLAGVSGEVLLEFVVDSTGRTKAVHAMQSPHPLLTERAIEALGHWRFTPGRRQGRLVNTRLRLPIRFELGHEKMDGLDGLLSYAQARATELGESVAADALELRMAFPTHPLDEAPLRRHAQAGQTHALLLLVIDATGTPLRGHVLNATPDALGPEALAVALRSKFRPRLVDGVAVPFNGVLPYIARPTGALAFTAP